MDNSGAILNYPKFNLNMVRPGIMTYGVHPGDETNKLSPVMTFKTRIVLLKDFPAGYSIGYGSSYITNKPTRIATIPVGYGDGYGYILSNQGEALIGGKRAPIVASIHGYVHRRCYPCPAMPIGDEVVSWKNRARVHIGNDIAAMDKTVSYEVLCALGKRAPRVFLQKGRTDAVEPRLRRIFIPDEEKSISSIDNIIRHCFQARTGRKSWAMPSIMKCLKPYSAKKTAARITFVFSL